MKFTTIPRRIAVTGATTALAAGALVGLGTTAAHADPIVTNTYVCSASGQQFPVTLTTNAPGIENFVDFGLHAGAALPGGALTVTNTFTVSDAVHSALVGLFHVTRIDATDFTGSFGGNPVGVDGVFVTMAGFTQNSDGSWSSNHADANADGQPDEGNGSNAAFTAPEAGAQPVTSPATLGLLATTEAGSQIPVDCTIAPDTTPGNYSVINLVKNDSVTTGKATKKSFVLGKAAKVKATVTGGAELVGDKVLLKKGTKTLDSALLGADGTAILSTKKLPVGKNKVTVVYKATGYNNGSKSDPVIVKVTR